MDFTTFIGIIIGFSLIITAIITNSSLKIFLNLPSALIVLGGTIGATLVNYSLSEILNLIKALKYTVFFKHPTFDEVINSMLRYSIIARKNGILALENELENIDDPFLKKGLRMVVDGMDEASVKNVLENQLKFLEERHKIGHEILESMGNYSPAMGLIGTLIGLVQMLQQMNNPSTIGPAMAVALITTFYGAILANLVFIPLSGKLKRRSEWEIFYKKLYTEGILSICRGENPIILKNRLEAFISLSETEKKLEEESE